MPYGMKLRPRKGQAAHTRKGSGTSRRSKTITNNPTKRVKRSKARNYPLASPNAPTYPARFPIEVWMMILAYHPCADGSDDIEALCMMEDLLPQHRQRDRILRALSQTCKFLRDLFLPLLWESVETCTRDPQSDAVPRDKLTVYILRRHSLELSRTPALAALVRTFTVSLHHCPAIRFFQQFARCLSALPNLRCLRIIYCDLSLSALEAEFKRRRYPQVRKLILPANAISILEAFPEVTSLIITRPRPYEFWRFVRVEIRSLHRAICTHCHRLNSLMIDVLADPLMMDMSAIRPEEGEKLAAAVPNLDTIIVSIYLYPDEAEFVPVAENLRYLSKLPNLAHITINLIPAERTGRYRFSASFAAKALACYHAAKNILEKKTHARPKSLVLRCWNRLNVIFHRHWPPSYPEGDFASWNSTDNIEIVPQAAVTPESSLAEFLQ